MKNDRPLPGQQDVPTTPPPIVAQSAAPAAPPRSSPLPLMVPVERTIHNLSHQAPKSEEAVAKIEALRAAAKVVGLEIHEFCPESRERSLALTALEEMLQWSIAAVVRNQ